MNKWSKLQLPNTGNQERVGEVKEHRETEPKQGMDRVTTNKT